MSLIAIFTLIALVLFVLATFNVTAKYNLTAAGLAFLSASLLVPMLEYTKVSTGYRPMVNVALSKAVDQVDQHIPGLASSSGMMTVKNSGAKGDGVTNDTPAVTAADTATTGAVAFTPGTYLLATTPTVTGPLEVYPGAILTGPGAAPLGYSRNALHQSIYSTAADQFASRYIRRNALHTGGTVGYTSAGLRVDTYTGALNTNFEWAIVGMVDNYATAGENVGGYFQGRKRSTGPTWGATLEVYDYGVNPTTGAVGVEVDVTANGTDNNSARVGVDTFVRKLVPGGADAVASWGYRVANDGLSKFKVGYGAYAGSLVDVVFDASTATTAIAGLKLKANQPIAFSTDNTRQLYHTGGGWAFAISGLPKASIADSGAYYVGADQVAGKRVKGAPAEATDLPSAIKLVNFLRAAGISHGSISR